MKVKVHIFAQGDFGRVYTVSRKLAGNKSFEHSDTRLFIDGQVGGDLEDEALDMEGKLELMTEKFGIDDGFFRPEGTHNNRPGLLAMPGSDESHRLRMYGYKKAKSLLLIGGGCHKWHDETGQKTSLDDFVECRKAATFIQGVNDRIEWMKSRGAIKIKSDGIYDENNKLITEFELTIADSLTY